MGLVLRTIFATYFVHNSFVIQDQEVLVTTYHCALYDRQIVARFGTEELWDKASRTTFVTALAYASIFLAISS